MRRFYLYLLVLFLLLSGSAGAAEYYVDADSVSPATPYSTPETAAQTFGAIYALLDGVDNTIYVADGVYDEYVVLSSWRGANVTIIGESATGTIISATGSHSFFSDQVNTKLECLTIRPNGNYTGAYIYSGASGTILENVILESADTHTSTLLSIADPAFSITRCKFRGVVGASTISCNGAAGGDITYCLGDCGNTVETTAWSFTQSGIITLANNTILGSATHGIIVNCAGTLNVYNNIIQAGGTGHCIYRSAGIVNESDNCLICPRNTTNFASGLTLDASDITTSLPGFVGLRGGYIIPHVDDAGNLSYAESVESLLDAAGMTGAFFVEAYRVESGDISSTSLQDMVSRGVMEVCSHAYSHTDMQYTHALHFSYAGAGSNPGVAFDGATVVLNCDSDVDKITIPIATYPTIGEIISAFNGVGNWTVAESTTDGQLGDHIYDSCLASSFAALSVTAAPCDIDFDRSGYDSGYFFNEITNTKTIIEDTIGSVVDPQTGIIYQCTSIGMPFNSLDSDVRQAFLDAGFLWGRGGSAVATLGSFDMLAISAFGASFVSGGTETEVRQKAMAFGFAAAHLGMCLPILAHSTSEMTLAEWGWALDEWAKIDRLTICSPQLFVDAITSSTLWTSDGDETFTRNYVPNSYNYTLKQSSICVGYGTQITGVHDQAILATDILGNPLYYTPSIGAYEPRIRLCFDGDATGTENGTRAYPYSALTDYTWTGYNVRAGGIIRVNKSDTAYGVLDFSSLTDTGEIAVEVEKGAKLTGFITNGDGYVAGMRGGSSGLRLGLGL